MINRLAFALSSSPP